MAKHSEDSNFPRGCELLDHMPDLSTETRKAYEKLGEFDYSQYNLTHEQRHAFEKCPEGGPFKMIDAIYQGQWWQGKRQGKGTQVWNDGSIFEGTWWND